TARKPTDERVAANDRGRFATRAGTAARDGNSSGHRRKTACESRPIAHPKRPPASSISDRKYVRRQPSQAMRPLPLIRVGNGDSQIENADILAICSVVVRMAYRVPTKANVSTGSVRPTVGFLSEAVVG